MEHLHTNSEIVKTMKLFRTFMITGKKCISAG
jgi:hypothetical protein